MVARSITRSPVALLFRLYTMYQPGGESEKAYILQYLVTPPKAQTAVEMVATLRQWERMLLRADNLSIAKPDPSLLVRGLNALVGDVWAKDRDVTFRTQLVKSRLGVDVSPTWVQLIFYDNLVTVRKWHLRPECQLVNEIEDKKLKELKDGVSLLKAKLEHLVHEEKLPWTTYVERYLEGGLAKDLWKALQGSFMKFLSEHMLDPLCQGIKLGEGWNHLKDLPFPRRLRKRMLDSTRWVVHLPMHRDEEQPKAEEYGPDAVVVNVPGELLTKAYAPLLWGAATGRIAAIAGSTPATSAASELQTMRMARALALYVVGSSGQLLKEFVKVTGMRESELNLGRLKLAKAARESSFEDQHVALGGSMKAMTPEKWKEHAAKMKYLLVAKFTIPESYVTGEFETTGSDPLDEEVDPQDLFDEEDKVSGGDDGHTDGSGGDDRDPGEAIVEGEPLDAEEDSEEADTGAGVGPIPLDIQAPKATYLLFAEPLLNDKGPTIASAIQSIVLYLQSLNIPVLRCAASGALIRLEFEDYPLATKVVNLFIQEKLGKHACWSTFSMHRNLNVKKHRDSHNARDKASYLIPISDFKDGGLWVQLKTDEEVKEEDVVILDGDRGTKDMREVKYKNLNRIQVYFWWMTKVHNAVVDVEEVIVLWIHRRIALRPVESDEPRADGGDPPVPEMDFRGGIPRLAMMCARDVNDLMKFVEVAEGETSEEDDVRLMKAAPENIYTPNIEDIVSKVSPESPLKVTHTVDPREVLPVVDVWVPAMEAELAALDKMAAIKMCRGPEAHRMRKDPNVVIVPSKLVFTVKPGLEPGKIRRKVRCVACGNFSGESAEELGDVYSAGATIDLVRICLAEKNAHKGWIAATDDIKTAFLRAPILCCSPTNRHSLPKY
ncbi:hypothetical protein AK812_SmicGene14162 [Symbiodinium microadriaticum]|uniref:Uncharacterized protein n=1 Tax=Symbiodinium microadriaticum TaxID=2951 RepID=A0A1Q9E687_SYMMI|nr:hypothetical protein AK812_SmicGene14162 [Symbiodinium microadriaticum]